MRDTGWGVLCLLMLALMVWAPAWILLVGLILIGTWMVQRGRRTGDGPVQMIEDVFVHRHDRWGRRR